MFTARDRPIVSVCRLADRSGYAAYGRNLRTKVWQKLRSHVKLAAVFGCIAIVGTLALVMEVIPGTLVAKRLRSTRLIAFLCRTLLRILRVRCTVVNESGYELSGNEGCLLLPNHVSYLDAILVSAYLPSVFITSREIEATVGLGHMTRAAGCAFVERRHRADLHRDIDQLARLLNAGLNVTLFPEGTTSPGDRLLDFKKSLLEAAVRSRCQVVPVAIQYVTVDGHPFDSSNCDSVAWYGDMTFLPHLLRLVATRSVEVRLTVMKPVPFRSHRSRKRLTLDVRSRIAARLSLPAESQT